jgi:hypothetical protein
LTNRSEAGSSQTFVPRDPERAGDFTSLSTTLRNPVDPTTNRPYTDASGAPCVAANRVRPGCFSPAARNYLERFEPRSASGTVVRLSPNPLDAYNYVTRIDYTVSQNNTLFGHYFRDHYGRASTEGVGDIDYVRQRSVADFKQYSVTNTHTFSPTFLNEATYSFMDAESFESAIDRVPPRDMGVNIDEGYLGVGSRP